METNSNCVSREAPRNIDIEYHDTRNGAVRRYTDYGRYDGRDDWENSHVVAMVNGICLSELSECTVYGHRFYLFDTAVEGCPHVRHPVFILRDVLSTFAFSHTGESFRTICTDMIRSLMQFAESLVGDPAVPWIREEQREFRGSLYDIFQVCNKLITDGGLNDYLDFYYAMMELYGCVLVEKIGGILVQGFAPVVPVEQASWRNEEPREEPLSPPKDLLNLI